MIPWFEVPALGAEPFSVDVPTLLALAGVVATMGFARARARRAGLSARRAVDGCAVILMCSLLLGHTLDVLLYRPHVLHADWQTILPWHGGYCSLGTLIGLSVGVIIMFREAHGGLRWDYLDALVPAFLLGLGILRVGCFLGHHHAGCRSNFLLAVGYPGGSRHDLGLYEALLVLGLLGVLRRLERSVTLCAGVATVGTGCVYAAGRLGIEFLRGDDLEVLGRVSDPRYAGLTLVQYGALVALTLGLLWWWRIRSCVWPR